ncbi:hypothetical protein D9758_008071 [Tetrapyrgos nigripes]|uniref:U3 small nucleolar RNA-associated protein 10 n=1 Tax=Tetrapyrgos nigripes TaxID=182062 RepID=A0A8H5D373_9AGAR|nr:hypothetical protein D9758_008071 [Tetrapyrgos nigripes]
MVSSLAAQLAQNASLNSSLLADRSRRKPSESYLFTGREADQHDLESIYALGYNGFLQLVSVDAEFEEYEESLFSSAAKATDRTLLSAEENSQLHAAISSFLLALGPYLLEAPAGKVLEWLVRRFRINEFDVDAILTLFLPYHETMHFAKMNTILHIQPNTTWTFLLPFKSAAQNVPRIALVSEMLKNTDVARFIATLLPRAIKEHRAHTTLIMFNAATLHDFIACSKNLNEGTIAFIWPALIDPLQNRANSNKDSILGSYALLSVLSQKCRLTPSALKAIVISMSNCARQVGTAQYLNALISVCEPQGEIEELPDATVKTVLRIANIDSELRDALAWEGAEKVLLPLLPGLLHRLSDEAAIAFLESLITAQNLPVAFIHRLTTKLIVLAIDTSSTASDITTSHQLLSNIQQRYSPLFHAVAEGLIESDEVSKESVEQLSILLSTNTGSLSREAGEQVIIDLIVEAANAEPRVRADAVQKLSETLAQGSSSLSPSDMTSIRQSLLSRVQDTHQLVLDALYRNPVTLLAAVLDNSTQYIDTLDVALNSANSKLKHALLKLHFSFLISHFCPKAEQSSLRDAFQRIIFPYLLYSKPRQRTANLVWDLVEEHALTNSALASNVAFEILRGCTDVRKASQDEEDSSEKMAKLNLAISSNMAENILTSNNYSIHLDGLIRNVKDSNAHARVLSLLITRALLSRLTGEHQVEAGHQILKTFDTKHLSEADLASLSADDISERLTAESLAQSTVLKPNSLKTTRWLQISIISMATGIALPDGLEIDWIANQSKENDGDNRGYRYASLKRDMYKLALTTGSALGMHLIRDLVVSLKHEALLFLAGVWMGAGNEDRVLQFSALQHATAFLEAHTSAEVGIDFQTIIPSLLVVLQNSELTVRRTALECIALLHKVADRKFTKVYAFDAIYGPNQDQIQYLSQDDLKAYLAGIVKHQEHFLFDPAYCKVFHEEHLRKVASNSKKESSYKYRVLCYLLSHINAMTLPSAQARLLEAVSDISDRSKTEILLPTIQLLAEKPLNILSRLFDSYLDGIATLCAAAFDLTVLADLNSGKTFWDLFVSLLRRSLSSEAILSLPSFTSSMAQQLKTVIFTGLNRERKFEVCKLILEQGSRQDSAAHIPCKNLLGALLEDPVVIIQLLNYLQSGIIDGPRASKRAKTTDAPEDIMSRLSILSEVLASRPLPGSFDLISHLLEALSKVMQSVASPQADITFIEQSLMSAIENAAEKVTEVPNLVPNNIRLDILVELIRVTDNPQTFHQALLLIANLTRLAPESVLHNIMPIFTFMGSNIFHRDDGYSFAVVQKTVDNIVPVMISSLKQTHQAGLNLYVAARDFLRVFTDANNHIPRHRRVNFFTHLVDVLGPADFLAPVCLLLVEKSSNRIVRQNSEDVQNALALPISLLHHYTPHLQNFVLTEMLRESKRLTQRVTDSDISQPTFLDESLFEEHSVSPSALYKRRSQAIVIFVGQAAKTFSSKESNNAGGELSDLVSILLKLSRNPDSKVNDIVKASRSCLTKVMSVMSVLDFIDAVLLMLSSKDAMAQEGALDLLSDRLSKVSSSVRKTIIPSINKILGHIQKFLSQQTSAALASSSLKAASAIGQSLYPGEENSMTSLVPQIISGIRSRQMTLQAIASLVPLPAKLGPRLIPYFREIVSELILVLREDPEDLITKNTVNVLQGLLTTISTFWSKLELNQLARLFLDLSASQKLSTHVMPLMKTLTKRAPPKVLLPTLCEIWRQVETSQTASFDCYFDMLQKSLRSADRPVVQENLRSLFSAFLSAFDSVKMGESETRAIDAFVELVVKLNEATFRPIFRRLHDWAFVSEHEQHRKVTFCHVYAALLDFFKGLMNPYMLLVLVPFTDVLNAFTASGLQDESLLTGVLGTLTKSLTVDDGSFWRDEKLRQVATPLIRQIPVCVRLNSHHSKALLQNCLVAVVENLNDETLLKSINLDLLMHTRSEESRVKLFALECSEALWKAHGGKLLGFVAETATFIAECCEDENDVVARESFRLKDAVESVAGSINGI